MYLIKKTDGTELGIVEEPTYIKIGKSGCYTNATRADAIGVAYNSTPYNLIGHSEIKDAETVEVVYINVGEELRKDQAAIAEVENALCELDAAAEEKRAEYEEALCELDSIISGGGDSR